MGCECASMDWSGVDLTREHHPKCPTKGSELNSTGLVVFKHSVPLMLEAADSDLRTLKGLQGLLVGRAITITGKGAYKSMPFPVDQIIEDPKPGYYLAQWIKAGALLQIFPDSTIHVHDYPSKGAEVAMPESAVNEFLGEAIVGIAFSRLRELYEKERELTLLKEQISAGRVVLVG